MATRVTDIERVAADGHGDVERHALVPPQKGSELALEAIRLAAGSTFDLADELQDVLVFVHEGEGMLGDVALDRLGAGLVRAGSSGTLRAGPDGLSCVRATVGATTDLHAPMGPAETAVALDHVEPGKATGARSFQVLFGPHNGSTRATLFVGYIPPGKAPWHYHLYDEIVWVLRGEGRVHVGDAVEALSPGSAFRLHAREVHIVENTQAVEELAVLGVFTPAGSPSAAYLTADVAAGYVPRRPGVRPHPDEDRQGMGQPVILAVEPDPPSLATIAQELLDRYERHYRVICVGTPAEAREQLAGLEASGEPLALVLAGEGPGEESCTPLLTEVRRAHPHAKRAMLIGWGEWGYRETGDAILEAIEHGRIDHYVVRPAASPDEQFHQAVSTFLLEWAEDRRTAPYAIQVVGDSWSGRAFELRSVLESCAFPHAFSLADSAAGRSLLGSPPPEELPVVILPDGTTLTNPSDTELTRATGSSVEPEDTEIDLLIVGAGAAGLSAAVYGASEGFRTLVVDTAGIGGQARSSSMIRNYLGFPRGISGALLARQAHEQAWILGARFVFMQSVTGLRADGDRLAAELSQSGQVRARAVVLATGADYRRLGVPALEALGGAGVFYGGTGADANRVAGHDVYVLGGANSAGQAALHLARFADRVTLVARARSLEAGMSQYLVRQLRATPNVELRLGTEVVGGGGDGWLTSLVLRDRPTGSEETVPADDLFLAIGANPRTDWLPEAIARDDQGFVLTGADVPRDGEWPLAREPYALETSMPGVLAVGDARYGSVKRVASAVGAGSIAIRIVHRLLEAGEAAAGDEAELRSA